MYPRVFIGLFLAAGVFLLGLVSPPAQAQLIQGSLTGNVTDPSGAAIPDAVVSVLNTETGQTRETTTNSSGQYRFPTLAAGSYELTVTNDGFRSYIQQGVSVSINDLSRIDVALELGQVAEQVTVTAGAATLQTDRAEVRGKVTRESLENIPVPLGRNYQMLVGTLPGVSQPENAHSVPSNPSRAVRFSVNGTSRSNNNTRIDGASQTNVWLPHMTAYTPSLEAIEQVNVVTNSFDAEQGLAGGAAINLSIKSGTNDIHGSAFWFHNNQKLNSAGYFTDRSSDKPKFIYNQAGATVGGPIKKNRIFYFVAYEASRERSNEQRIVDVPDAAMRGGDLSRSPTAVYDPFTGNADGSGRMPFAGNIIPEASFSGASRILTTDSRFPAPNLQGTGEFGLNRNFVGSGKYQFDRDTIDSKVNFHINDKLSAFVRFSFLDYRMSNPQVFGDFGGNRLHRTNSNPGNGFGNTYSGTYSMTYVHSPNLVFDGYFGYTLQDTNVTQDFLDQNIGRDFLGIPGTNGTRGFEGGWPRLQIDGFEQLGISNNFQPYFRKDPQWQIVANGNWTKGKHEVRFGTDLYWQHLNHEQPEFPGAVGPASGGFRFRGATTTTVGGASPNDFNSFGSFLLGTSRETGRIVQYPDEYKTRTSLFSLYARDRWQVNQRLTLTLGLRWEYYPFPERENRGLERFNADTNQMLVCGLGAVPQDCGIDVKKDNFAPRVGLAYRLNDSTVVRAGYGLTIDPFNWARPLRTNFPVLFVMDLPFSNSRSFATTLDQGLPAAPPQPDGDIVDLPLAAAATTFDQNADRGYIQSWNFTLEKQLPGDWIVSAGYVGTRSIRHLTRLESNYANIGEGNAGRQLFQQFGRTAATTFHSSLGTPKYDALQTRAEKRFSDGLMMSFNYTWGHARNFNASDSGDGVRVNIPEQLGRNYGRSGFDYRHTFNLTGVWELPFGPGKQMATEGAPAAILGGWQLNWLGRISSGRPVTFTASDASLNAPGSGQFADCLGEVNRLGGPDLYFARSSFGDPNDDPINPNRFGTCGSNNVSAPGLVNFDLGLFREFALTERMRLQFRTEAFNISNTPHFNAPNTNISSGSFGVISGTQNTGREGIDQRVFRFGLKLGW